jgi:hypothetical protein
MLNQNRWRESAHATAATIRMFIVIHLY